MIVMTGVGNLGALSLTVPSPETDWGGVFTLKIVAVGGLLVGSLLRTLLVAQYVARASASPAAVRLLRRGYELTALYLLGLFGLAEVLVYGG